MFNDIEYEKDGVKKFAQERFKDELQAAGWSVVGQSVKPVLEKTAEQGEEKKSRGRPKKENKEG